MLPCLYASTALFADKAPEVVANPAYGLIDSLALIVGAAGAGVIVWGAYCSIVRLIAAEAAAARGQVPKSDTAVSRQPFSAYLLLGLEFLIAANVIKALLTPDWQHIVALGGLVLIRTIITLDVRWETSRTLSLRGPEAMERLNGPPEVAPSIEEPVVAATTATVGH
jgi:uncharacterized membrane protein